MVQEWRLHSGSVALRSLGHAKRASGGLRFIRDLWWQCAVAGGLEDADLPADFRPADLYAKVESEFAGIRKQLERLVGIPSVSADGYDAGFVVQSAEATAEWLESSGLDDVRLLTIEGAHPAVFGATRGPAGAPTVLLYAHHDVQPAGPADLWASPAFAATEREGRLFGRGTADDKAGIAVHAATLQAWDGKPPVNVAVFIEGEEEIASRHLPEFLGQYAELLRADAVVLADCSNWAVGRPALITSLRGIIDCTVEVRTLDHAVHSGAFGGPVPDALTVLSRLIASLHDDNGDVAVAGLRRDAPGNPEVKEAALRRFSGLRPDVSVIGSGPLADRLWARPAVCVLGIDAPPTLDAAHKLVPMARAKISVRLAPGDDTRRAMEALTAHLRRYVPWGAEITITPGTVGAPHRIQAAGHAFEAFRMACADAWGLPPVEVGTGGSLPLVAALADSFPAMAQLLTGVADPDSNAHSENESVHLEDLKRCCANEALLLGYLAAQT
jgi:cysteinylglycine-S-conjugate dipeptidase